MWVSGFKSKRSEFSDCPFPAKKMSQRKSAAGRPSGTDGSDFSYRMVVDSRKFPQFLLLNSYPTKKTSLFFFWGDRLALALTFQALVQNSITKSYSFTYFVFLIGIKILVLIMVYSNSRVSKGCQGEISFPYFDFSSGTLIKFISSSVFYFVVAMSV